MSGIIHSMDGILPVYKPVGITSFDVIRAFKRAQFTGSLPVKYKVGHGGTLDPFADGVLLLLLGVATKQMSALSALRKTYRAVAQLGARSDTLDRTGEITQCHSDTVTRAQIEDVAQGFVGEIEQVIPDYSAAKIHGVPRYKLARRGEMIEQKSKRVTIYSLKVLRFDESIHRSRVEFEATVSSGTYIRQLSYDIFKSIGIESYLERLTRTKIGKYRLNDCVRIEDFSSSKWQDRLDSI